MFGCGKLEELSDEMLLDRIVLKRNKEIIRKGDDDDVYKSLLSFRIFYPKPKTTKL